MEAALLSVQKKEEVNMGSLCRWCCQHLRRIDPRKLVPVQGEGCLTFVGFASMLQGLCMRDSQAQL